MKPPVISFDEFAKLYCESQECTPEELREKLNSLIHTYQPMGFMLLRCEMMDSSRFGSRVILPYGPLNTFKHPPDHPISPRGLASDMSVVEALWIPIIKDREKYL